MITRSDDSASVFFTCKKKFCMYSETDLLKYFIFIVENVQRMPHLDSWSRAPPAGLAAVLERDSGNNQKITFCQP